MLPIRNLANILGLRGDDSERLNRVVTDPPTDLEKLSRGGEYYPVGLPPRNLLMGAKTLDVFRMMRGLRGRNVGDTYLMVANISANEDAEFRGLRELVSYEAVQDILDEDEVGYGERVPVLLSSHLNEGELKFEPMLERVKNECVGNSTFDEAVYACVPPNMRHRKHRGKTLAELRALPGKKAYEIATQRMEYVLQQIALVLCLQGRKIGHHRERPYNAATILAAQLLGLDHRKYAYETVEFEGEEGDIPYRVIEQARGRVDQSLLSAHDTLAILKPRELDLDPDNPLQMIQVLQESAEAREVEMNRLEKRFNLIGRLYTRMIDKAACVPGASQEMKTRLSESIAAQYASEIIMTLAEGPEAKYKFMFKESGVLEVVEGTKSLEEWMNSSCLLPFICDHEEGESSEHYFLRFVNQLLHSDGPVIPNMRRTGLTYTLCHQLRRLAMGEEAEQRIDERYPDWRLPYSYFETAMFQRDDPYLVPPDGEVSIYDVDDHRWETLTRFFDLIRNTTLENIYRSYLGMPENPSAINQFEDREALQPFFNTPFLSASLQRFFKQSLG